MLGKLIKENVYFEEQIVLLKERIGLIEHRLMSELTTDQLKQFWDSYDGAKTSDPIVSGEMVHLELNLRGEGDYCAV